MNKTPLKYNISSWDQLVNCMSNYSTKLHLSVNHITQDTRLSGTLIQVNHGDFGCLFSYLVDGCGPLLDSDNPLDYELTTNQILTELSRYGYLITYSRKNELPDAQIDYLRTMDKLGFDKIRVLSVYHYNAAGVQIFGPHVVLFNVEPNPGWLDNTYSASHPEYVSAITSGTAVDISSISVTQRFQWDWLDYVASISDILAEYNIGGQPNE